MTDDTVPAALARLVEQVRAARADGAHLAIRGGGTKDFYGEPPVGEPLDTRDCAGIVDYEPTELVITVRAGTPLAEVERTMAAQGQMLAVKHAFDPAGLLNPGKVIPTLQRCAEYGKMHVRKGLLPFPELERF